jgi:lipopolysaccharide export system permease protein
MHVLTRSIVIDYLLVFLLTLAIMVALLLFVGATLDLPKDVGLSEIVLMLPYLLPEATRNAMQAAALFAACSVFGRLSAGNEILALTSLGVSPIKVIRPIVVLAVLMSLTCVWLYDVGEAWGQKGIHRVLVNSAEAIAYRFLRTKHTYAKGPITLNVKTIDGRKLIRPMLIMERPGKAPITVSAEEGELRTLGRRRELSLVMRNGTAYIGDAVSMAFPEAMEQIIPLGESFDGPQKWPPEYCTLSDLRNDIVEQAQVLVRLEQNPSDTTTLWSGEPTPPDAPPVTHAQVLGTEREHMHWLKAQVNRRWTNGFFCLAFVMVGIPVSMRVRSRDYLTSFFACFLPIVLLNHPLHNFCIKLAESGRAPAQLPWVGNIVLIGLGAWLLVRALRH